MCVSSATHRKARLKACFRFLRAVSTLQAQDSGTIDGAVIPAVSVNIINTGTHLAVTVKTDQDGDYSSPPLKIGTCRTEAEAAGFKKTIADELPMRPTPPLLQTQTTSTGRVVDGRGYLQLVTLAAGNLSSAKLNTAWQNAVGGEGFVVINCNRAMQSTFL